MDTPLTTHARARMQQRAIRADALERLLEFGREAFDHRGGVILYFAGRNRKRVAPRERRLYAVLSTAGEVITVGHRSRRIRRD